MEEAKLTKKERRALAKQEKQKERQKNQNVQRLKKWTALVLVLLLVALGGYKFWKWINTPLDVPNDTFSIAENDHVKGNPDASNVIIEYSDFQCPACASYLPALKEVVGSRDDVMLVYRHFPLSQIHSNAFDAAKAAEAAGKQDKFWEMHDILFDKQGEWEGLGNPIDKFSEYASKIGMDEEKFKSDFDSSEIEDKIYTDLTAANAMRLNSTPTFFVNGVKTKLSSNYDGIVKLLEKN